MYNFCIFMCYMRLSFMLTYTRNFNAFYIILNTQIFMT